jgi:spore coat polysaccharide biosynthesis predicted glycosyltransferase SpsG
MSARKGEKTITFLVDSGPLIGMGHLTRSVRLAKEILRQQPDTRIHFLSMGESNAGADFATTGDREAPPVRPNVCFDQLALPGPPATNPYKLLDGTLLGAAEKIPFDTCVIDSFRLSGKDVMQWAEKLQRQVFVFDGANRTQDRDLYPAEIRFPTDSERLTIINTNVSAPGIDYPPSLKARGLFGPHVDTFDQRLFSLPRLQRNPGDDRTIFTSFGGSDDGRYLGPLYQTLLNGQRDAGEVLPWRYIVHTPNDRAAQTLTAVLEQLPPVLAERVTPLRSFNMVDVLAQTDAYLGAAGLTAQEAGAAKVPTIGVMSIIENQHEQLEAMKLGDFAFFIRDPADAPRTAQMVALGERALSALRRNEMAPLPSLAPGGLPKLARSILQAG